MLEIRNLTVGYGKREVLRGFSAGFERGEVTAILGPNGSGKSTLLKAVAGLIPRKEGDILLCGHTHIAADEKCDGFRYINPGSVSIPKENTGNGYIILENATFTRKLLK